MRTNGEAVSITVGEATVKIGEAFDLTPQRVPGGPSFARLSFKPYWPGYFHAVGLIADGRKRAKQKSR